jgi:hypothetical protein
MLWIVTEDLVGKPEGKGSLGSFSHRWEYIKVDVKLIGWGDMDWIHVAQDRASGRLFLHTVMNCWVGFCKMWIIC